MKHFLLLLLIYTSSLTAQENDSLKGPANVIDGIYIPLTIPCDHDSIARIHEMVKFTMDDLSLYNYSFQSGNKNYIELIIQTRNCKCRDCEFSERIIIDISDMEKGELGLSPSNLTWLRWNSWIIPKQEQNFYGTLHIRAETLSLTLYRCRNNLQFPVENIEIKEMVLTF